MKSNKTTSIIVLAAFLFQSLTPSIAFSSSGNNELIASNAQSVLSEDELSNQNIESIFDEDVDELDQLLILEYLDYVDGSHLIRKKLRKVYGKLNALLLDDIWSNLNIKDEVILSQLAESNEINQILKTKIIPQEEALTVNAIQFEKKLNASIEEINRGGAVPDGMMETARNLESLYRLKDELLAIKDNHILSIIALRGSVYTGFLKGNSHVPANLIKRVEKNLSEIELTVSNALALEYDLETLNNEYQKIQEDYNAEVAGKLHFEEERTDALIGEIKKQAGFLKESGDKNENNHASVLEQVVKVLDYRGKIISEELMTLGSEDVAGKTFLYVPKGIGENTKTEDTANKYKKIISRFITETGSKVKLSKNVLNYVRNIKENLSAEKSLFKKHVDLAMNVSIEKKQQALGEANGLYDNFNSSLSDIESTADGIFAISNKIKFLKPETVIHDIDLTSDIVSVNKAFGKLLIELENLRQNSSVLNLQLAEMLISLSGNELEQSLSFASLNDVSASRGDVVDSIFQTTKQLKASFKRDAQSFLDLRNFSVEIIKSGKEIYLQKIAALDKRIKEEKAFSGQPYYDYLKEVIEVLKYRHQILNDLSNILPEKIALKKLHIEDDIEGDSAIWSDVWSEADFFGSTYSNILEQLEGLVSLEKYYEKKNFTFESSHTGNLINLFEISQILKNTPVFELQEDSIDVIFRIGSRVVAFKGIGNPSLIKLSKMISENGNLFDAPYIGKWSFSPKAAWGGVKKRVSAKGKAVKKGISTVRENVNSRLSQAKQKVKNRLSSTKKSIQKKAASLKNTVVSTKRTLSKSAQKMIHSAKTRAGKIINETSNALKIVKTAVKKAASDPRKIVSKVIDVAKDLGSNILNNALLDENGGIDLWKVGGIAVGVVLCGAAGAATAGTGAAVCFTLLAKTTIGASVVKGVLDTAAMKKHGSLISQENADKMKSLVEFASFLKNPQALKNVGNLRNVKKNYNSLKAALKIIKDDRFKKFGSYFKHLLNSGKYYNKIPRALNKINDLLEGIKAGLEIKDLLESAGTLLKGEKQPSTKDQSGIGQSDEQGVGTKGTSSSGTLLQGSSSSNDTEESSGTLLSGQEEKVKESTADTKDSKVVNPPGAVNAPSAVKNPPSAVKNPPGAVRAPGAVRPKF